jgi:CheY-like chemotaxis protein
MEHSPKSQNNIEISILLVDPDRELSIIIKQVLRSLGFLNIYTSKDGVSALHMIEKFEIDLIITDLEMLPMNGLEFIKHIRRSPISPNPCIPIIVLTAQARRKYVEMARDSGMTEFLAKPFTANDLCSRILRAIEYPRDFVATPTYIGPDRRRKIAPADLTNDRRHDDEELIVVDNQNHKISEVLQKTDIFMIRNDNRIKNKIGSYKSAAELFSEESIKEAQNVITQARESFISWFVNDLEVLEKLFTFASMHKSDSITQIAETAIQIKARAGTFGYHLASKVAYNLHLITVEKDFIDSMLLIIIRKHIDVLYVIVRRDITGDGAEIGTELLDGLNYISQKYKAT